MESFAGKVGLVQRVLPSYRAPFFNALGNAFPEGLSVFAGEARANEMIQPIASLQTAQLAHGANWHLFGGRAYLCIQIGLLHWLKGWDPDILIVEANPRYLRTPAAVRWMHAQGRAVIG